MLLDAFRLYFLLVCAMKNTHKHLSIWFLDVKTKQKTEKTEVKPHKNKHELQTKHSPKKKCVCLVSRGFGCNAYPHPLRVAAVGSARYCIITNWLSKQSTHLQV